MFRNSTIVYSIFFILMASILNSVFNLSLPEAVTLSTAFVLVCNFCLTSFFIKCAYNHSNETSVNDSREWLTLGKLIINLFLFVFIAILVFLLYRATETLEFSTFSLYVMGIAMIVVVDLSVITIRQVLTLHLFRHQLQTDDCLQKRQRSLHGIFG